MERRGGPSPLFLTRKFPPAVGGMEVLAENIWTSMSRRFPGARLIANRRDNRRLPLWWLASLPRAAFLLASRRSRFVLTGDALAYALFRPLLVAARVPHATMVMGLDVTYQHPIYRAIVHRALRGAPHVLAISEATARAAIDVGVAPDRVSVIRIGPRVPSLTENDRTTARQSLAAELGIDADGVIAVTVGRLVRRKGVLWFVRNVLPHLPESVTYLIAGSGPMAPAVEDAIGELGLAGRAKMLGQVDDSARERLLRGADLFVQPNVRVPGDMEGFGLVVLESAMRGTLTVASGIEGILDAVVHGRTGILLPAEEADAWIERISHLVSDVPGLRRMGWQYGVVARETFGGDLMADELERLLRRR